MTASLEDALAFSARHPVGDHDAALRRRLLLELTSAAAGQIVVVDELGELLLVAAVVDVVADPAAPAQLEVLGARAPVPAQRFEAQVLAPALAFARSVGRRALHVARPAFVDGV